MNTAEGVRRLAQVIRGGSTVLAGCVLLYVLLRLKPIYDLDLWLPTGEAMWDPWYGPLVEPLVIGAFSAAIIVVLGYSVAWVLMGFAGDRSPPRGPGD